VPSSDADASTVRAGFAAMQLTSSVWPVNTRSGALSPTPHTTTVRSDPHVANCAAPVHSTSSTGALWWDTCCTMLPVAASHTIADLSTAGSQSRWVVVVVGRGGGG
jgi:hypothetical protein